ncbi:MAG: ATP-binding protein [Cytophagales bacterium]|nr:ATP-binding protein [Armatimonadota bacterium]
MTLDFWLNLLSGDGFMPRRYCGVWDNSLVSLHLVSDVVTWLSYLWIPLLMLRMSFVRRQQVRLQRATLAILLLYALFITACGWTHFFDALMFYYPVYRINGLIRGITATVSLVTAISLIKLLPLALDAPLTILTQKAALRQQHQWLRDILDSATEGRLMLCETRTDLPAALDECVLLQTVRESWDLRALRQSLRKVAVGAGFSSDLVNDLLLAVHEAAMNALTHAGGGTVCCRCTEEKIQVWIEDIGKGIPLDRLPIATLKQGYSTAGTAGQGWYLVLNLVSIAYLLTGTKGTTVVLEVVQPAASVSSPPFSAARGEAIAVA